MLAYHSDGRHLLSWRRTGYRHRMAVSRLVVAPLDFSTRYLYITKHVYC